MLFVEFKASHPCGALCCSLPFNQTNQLVTAKGISYLYDGHNRRALEVTALATGDSVSGVSRGKQIGSIIKKDGSTKASTIKAKAESVGFTSQQSSNDPLKLVDETGTARVTIKGGSDRAPGSAAPHVELKDSNGQRVSPSGSPVTRKSPENHTQIENDL